MRSLLDRGTRSPSTAPPHRPPHMAGAAGRREAIADALRRSAGLRADGALTDAYAWAQYAHDHCRYLPADDPHRVGAALLSSCGYLDPVTIAVCLTWSHLHPRAGRLPTADGLQAVAARARALDHVPHPLQRAALTGLARLTVSPRPTDVAPRHARSGPITHQTTTHLFPLNTRTAAP
ncbi:hypothetical protein ACIBTZ_31910 [Micromonospora sp. NPDC049460]|uniref:hypothetical protein n=1 Tax=Micromonospora sp. NPDC049460 TaxID=3364272 RepID=UPI00379754E4